MPIGNDADMTVTSVARHLDMNPSYLAHVFAEETGTRMSRYIAMRRIKLAERCRVYRTALGDGLGQFNKSLPRLLHCLFLLSQVLHREG